MKLDTASAFHASVQRSMVAPPKAKWRFIAFSLTYAGCLKVCASLCVIYSSASCAQYKMEQQDPCLTASMVLEMVYVIDLFVLYMIISHIFTLFAQTIKWSTLQKTMLYAYHS